MFGTRTLSRSIYLLAGFGLLALLGVPSHLAAQTGKSITAFDNICLAEAKRAEARHGIPAGLMQSITRVESGRKMVTGEYMPWAWTLNDQGEGLFFDNRETALAYLVDAVATPDHSVDVGCMQVNTKWHADGFLEIADMLDPVHNTSYAAGFLLDLHAAHQSWDEAVKHYHSSEPRKNVVYHRRVLAELERYMGQDAPASKLPGAGDADISGADDPDNNPMMLATAPAELPGKEVSMPDEGSADAAVIAPATDPALIVLDPVVPVKTVPADVGPATGVSSPTVSGLKTGEPSNMAPVDAPMAEHNLGTDPIWEKQPNLAPHRSRVEKFRRILAQQAG